MDSRFSIALEELKSCREIAMNQTVSAKVPECGEFGAIAQGLSAAIDAIEAALLQQEDSAVPEQIVDYLPNTITPDMMAAGVKILDEFHEWHDSKETVSALFKAILSAAPDAPVTDYGTKPESQEPNQ